MSDVSTYCKERKIKLSIKAATFLDFYIPSSEQLTFLHEPAIGTSLTMGITHAPENFDILKFSLNDMDFSTRLWGINLTNSVVIARSLVLRSVVLK